jgi:hypothetical protein
MTYTPPPRQPSPPPQPKPRRPVPPKISTPVLDSLGEYFWSQVLMLVILPSVFVLYFVFAIADYAKTRLTTN